MNIFYLEITNYGIKNDILGGKLLEKISNSPHNFPLNKILEMLIFILNCILNEKVFIIFILEKIFYLVKLIGIKFL